MTKSRGCLFCNHEAALLHPLIKAPICCGGRYINCTVSMLYSLVQDLWRNSNLYPTQEQFHREKAKTRLKYECDINENHLFQRDSYVQAPLPSNAFQLVHINLMFSALQHVVLREYKMLHVQSTDVGKWSSLEQIPKLQKILDYWMQNKHN